MRLLKEKSKATLDVDILNSDRLTRKGNLKSAPIADEKELQENIDLVFNYWKKRRYFVKIITFDKKKNYLNSEIGKFVINLELIRNSKSFFYSLCNNIKRINKLRKILRENQKVNVFSFICTTNICNFIRITKLNVFIR